MATSTGLIIPPGILEEIIRQIQRPKDLLAFALTCRACYSLIVPFHIQFRSIRCDFFRPNLWKALAIRPILSSRVYHLKIVPEKDTPAIIPKCLGDEAVSDDPNQIDMGGKGVRQKVFKEFLQALSCMTGLTRLTWNYTEEHRPPVDIFQKLGSRLLGLQFHTHHATGNSILRPDYSLWTLTDLICLKLDLAIDDMPNLPEQLLASLGTLLKTNSQTLRDLSLTAGTHRSTRNLVPVLADLKLPNLQRLTLLTSIPNIYPDDYTRMLSNFLGRLSSLESLWIKVYGSLNDRLLPLSDSLPRLRCLFVDVPLQTNRSHLLIPEDVAGRLEYFAPCLAQIPVILNNPLSSLRCISCSFEFTGNLLGGVVEAAPLLEKLQFTNRWYSDQVMEVLPILVKLKRLTHLAGANVLTLYGDYNLSVIQGLASIPRLTYIEVTSVSWITIERTPDGQFSRFYRVPDISRLSTSTWGNFFWEL